MNTMNTLETRIDIIPTVFPQYNLKNHLSPDHQTTSLALTRLKHGHLRVMQKLEAIDQMQFLMSQLTGLDQADLDELDMVDSAKITEIIYGYMKRFSQIAKEMERQES